MQKILKLIGTLVIVRGIYKIGNIFGRFQGYMSAIKDNVKKAL